MQRAQKSVSVYNQSSQQQIKISDEQCRQDQNYQNFQKLQSSKHIAQIEFFDENVKAKLVPKVTTRRSNDRYSEY